MARGALRDHLLSLSDDDLAKVAVCGSRAARAEANHILHERHYANDHCQLCGDVLQTEDEYRRGACNACYVLEVAQ